MSSHTGGPDGPNGPDHLEWAPPYADAPEPTSGSRTKTFAIVGGIGAAVVLIAGGALAATAFFSTGAQPAEALPDNTVAYLSVDLNPSGGQKIEAIRLLRKFPAVTESMDINEDSDLLEEFFNKAVENGDCTDIDYDKDIDSWLGARGAVAAVDGGGEMPDPVIVLQVKDADKAKAGLDRVLAACGGTTDQQGIAVEGDWAVFAETQEIADDVAADAKAASLAADATFQKWTDEAGGDAIVSMYVSPEVSKYADQIAKAGSDSLLGGGLTGDDFSTSDDEWLDEFAEPEVVDPETEADVKAQLEKFEGAAAAIRFDDAGIEIEFAGGVDQKVEFFSDSAGDLVGSLPENSVAALGLGLAPGWLDQISDQLTEAGVETSLDEVLSEVGLDRAQVEKGLGKGLAVVAGPGIDPDAISNGGPEDIPLGMVVGAEADDFASLIDTVSGSQGDDLKAEYPWLTPVGGDGIAVLTPNDALRDSVTGGGKTLADNDEYKSVTDGSGDAQSLVFVNFNADDNWLVRLAGADSQEVADNLDPLKALGLVAWFEDGTSHVKFKLTTD